MTITQCLIGSYAVEPPVIGFLNININTGNLTNYTFSSVGLGTAEADRKIFVIGHHSPNLQDTNSFTVGGSTMNLLVDAKASSRNVAAVAELLVTSGTSADVVMALGGGELRAALGVFSATGLGTGALTPHDSDTATTGAGAVTLTLDVPKNGVVIWGYTVDGVRTTVASGTIGASQSYNTDSEGNITVSGGFANIETAISGGTIIITPDGGGASTVAWAGSFSK